jgi:uncharacterized protein
MNVFIDTSAFLAVLVDTDEFHAAAKNAWSGLLSSTSTLFSSNYVSIESIALLQNRFGIEAVRLFQTDILPVIKILWVDETIHQQALSALLTANRRSLSLVDCSSFEIIRRTGLDAVFSFDHHFREQGFPIIPEQ